MARAMSGRATEKGDLASEDLRARSPSWCATRAVRGVRGRRGRTYCEPYCWMRVTYSPMDSMLHESTRLSYSTPSLSVRNVTAMGVLGSTS